MTSTSRGGHAVRQRASRKPIPCQTVSTPAGSAEPRLMRFADPGIEWHPEPGTRRPATSAHIVRSALDLSKARTPAVMRDYAILSPSQLGAQIGALCMSILAM